MTLCECGCGSETELGGTTNTKRGLVKGQPNRFIKYHHHRLSPRGEDSSGYKKGKTRTQHGYIKVLVQKDHPYFEMARISGYNSYYILEHRLVMAQYINRILRIEEIVHHKNEDKTDNRIENLALFHHHAAHLSYHRKTTPRDWHGRFMRDDHE